MYLAYFDESGDDGMFDPMVAHGSSQYMIYSNIYLKMKDYKIVYDKMLQIRRNIKDKFKISFIRSELHTRDFLLGKTDFASKNHKYKFIDFRIEVLKYYAQEISKIPEIRLFSTVIDKQKHKKLKNPEQISEKLICCSLTKMNYSISEKFNVFPDFIMISDQGREAVTRKVVRKMQVYAPVYTKGKGVIDGSIKNMIEDCLFKNSQDSYFLQLADFVSYFSMLWITKDNWEKKLQKHVTLEEVSEILNILCPVFNSKCSNDPTFSRFGLNCV